MRPGLPASVVLHATLIAWIVVGLPWKRPAEDAVVVDAMPIEFVPVADVAALRLGQKTAKPKDEVTPKETKQAAKESEGARAGTDKLEEPPPPVPQVKPEPPKPEPPKPEPPKPEPPKPEPIKAPEPRPQPAPKPEPVKAPEPKPELPKEAEKAKDLGEGKPPVPKEPPKDTKALDKLLEDQKKLDEKKAEEKRLADAKAAADAKARADAKAAADRAAKAAADKAAAEKAAQEARAKSQFNPGQISDILNKNQTGSSASKVQQTASLGSPSGRLNVARMTQSETDALVGQIKRCWNPPIGSAEAGIGVTLRFSMNQDGTLSGQPEIVDTPNHPLGVALAASARRALQQCGPYKMPPEKYAAWRLVEATFNPKDVF
ncbi:MAG: cell envelope integrity protein TolA [Siculibacillus sp.]|nr:cell envelope integrity protein TolA [Siculibacillus sp.]